MEKTINLVPCIGCGALVPDITGPAHRYIGASPGCWEIFGLVCAREYASPRLLTNHKLTVDSYAVQHPGTPSPQSIRSVAGHLISLHLILEKNVDPASTPEAMRRIMRLRDKFRWLTPPANLSELPTICDIHGSVSEDAHMEKVREWSQALWSAWSDAHATIRNWAME